MIRAFLFLAVLLASGNSITLLAQSQDKTSEARRIWLKGFEIYEKAEIDEKLGKFEAALKGYEEAMGYFRKVQAAHPDWNAFLIDYRIKKCTQQTDAIKTLLRKPEEKKTVQTLPPKAAPSADTRRSEAETTALRAALLDANKKLEAAQASLAESRKEAARGVAATEQLRRINQEKIEIEKRYQIVSAELRKALENSSRPDSGIADEKLKKQMAKLTEKAAAAEEKAKKLEEANEAMKRENQSLKMAKTESDFKAKEQEISLGNATKRLADMEKAAEAVRMKLEEEKAKSAGMKGDIEKLTKSLAEAKARNENLDGMLAELLEKNESGSIAQRLQTENKQLADRLREQTETLDEMAKSAEKLTKTNAEISLKNERLEKMLADYSRKSEMSTSDMLSLRTKLDKSIELSDMQKKDIARLLSEKMEMKKTLDDLSARLDALTRKNADYTELARYAADMDAKNRELLEKLKTAQDSASASTKKLEGISIEMKRSNEAVEAARKASAAEKENSAALLAERDNAKKRLEEVRAALELAKAELKKLQDQNAIYRKNEEDRKASDESVAGIEKSAKETASELERMKKEFLKAQKDRNEDLAKLEKALEENSKLKSDAETLRKNYKEAKGQISDISEENLKLNKMVEKLKTDNEKIRRSMPDAAKLSGLENQNEEKAKQIAALQEEIAKIKEHNDNLRARLEERVADSIVPKDFREEKRKLLSEIEEKNKIIEELKSEKKRATKKSPVKSSSKQIEQPAETSPKNEKAALLLDAAKEAEKDNDIESAVWHYQKVFEFDKDNQPAIVALARISVEKGENERAIAYLGNLPAAKIESGDMALSAAKTALKIFPADSAKAKAYYARALELGAKKDPDLDRELK